MTTLAFTELERVESRVLGALSFVDATTLTRVTTGLLVQAPAGARLQRNASGLYVITHLAALAAHEAAFEAPPATPAVGSVALSVSVADTQGRYLPRTTTVLLPRDPAAGDPLPADSLFLPIEIALYPAPTALTSANWALLRVTVTATPSGDALGGALLLASIGASVVARGVTDWRGEALVAVPGVPVTTWSDVPDVVTVNEIPAQLDVVFDPATGTRTSAAAVGAGRKRRPPAGHRSRRDRGTPRATLKHASQAITLATGRAQSVSFPLAPAEVALCSSPATLPRRPPSCKGEEAMPEYLAPGVYVEETSFRSKSIEGVGTSTTAFVGPTRRGPVDGTPELLTSLPDYERLYGSLENLGFSDVPDPERQLNFVAHAARAYFENGGSLLYVVRWSSSADTALATLIHGAGRRHHRRRRARPRTFGAAYNGVVRFRVATPAATVLSLGTAPDGSLLSISVPQVAPAAPVVTIFAKAGGAWADSAANALSLNDSHGHPLPLRRHARRRPAATAQLALRCRWSSRTPTATCRAGTAWASATPIRATSARCWRRIRTPTCTAAPSENLIWFDIGTQITAFDLLTAIQALTPQPGDRDPRGSLLLDRGTDGTAPPHGDELTSGTYASALAIVAGLEDVSIVATPGASAYEDAQAIEAQLIAHAEARRAYRIAVLDAEPQLMPSDVRNSRARIDTKYGALYYPWVIVSNPLARPGRDDIPKEISLPPSGFVSGIYARNDSQRGVFKAPANEVVTGALRFETDINFAQQEMLNPLGVNCLRYLSGRGYRLWGARLASSDPEWKYVSDRRYFNYLEASIDRGMQWAVFEPNGERLWANITQTVSDFLYNEWRSGALLGTTAAEAYFVRCDRSTMTQNDLDNGRLVCLIGVAVLKPAEFVIFRIGQMTADARP